MSAVFEIEITRSAREDLKALRKFEQQVILDGIREQLRAEPTVVTPNRKQLKPNDVADWELRLGRYRVFYDVDERARLVIIRAVGFKVGQQLYIRDERREL